MQIKIFVSKVGLELVRDSKTFGFIELNDGTFLQKCSSRFH